MEATQDEIIRGFATILKQTDGTYERLLASAHHRLENYHLLECVNEKDVLHTLFIKLIDGDRKWDKDKYPNFVIFLFMLIKSHISNLAEIEKGEVELDDQMEINSQDIPGFHGQMHEFKELCLNELGKDESLRKIFCAFSDGLANREVAKDLDMSICDVQNAKKRIIRKLQPVYDQYYLQNVRSKQ